MSLKTEIYARAMSGGSGNDRSRDAARANAGRFADWHRDNRDTLPSRRELLTEHDKARDTLQRYADHLQERGLSPATIHTYLHAPCRGLGVGMAEIDKPRRTSDTITRSRSGGNERSQREREDPAHERLVEGQKAIGIRRDELAELRGRDLCRDERGYLCVRVERGKGGKEQLQRVLPQHEDRVRELFRGREPDERVFSREEMANHIDLHGIRAEHAREAYDYYADRLAHEPGYRDQLRAELMDRWDAARGGTERQRERFAAEVYNDHAIHLRTNGTNYARAVEDDRPTVYDRTAVMAVSVYELSHWRTDVTITNYLV